MKECGINQFMTDQATDTFWLWVDVFKDDKGNHSFEEVALGVNNLLTVPVKRTCAEDI